MKVLRIFGAIGCFIGAAVLLVGNFIVNCIGLLIGAITRG